MVGERYTTDLRASTDHLSYFTVIAVVESHEEKLKLLRTLISQSIVEQKSSNAANGSQSHRFVLFVVDDNHSIGEYATVLENDDFTVGAYTVALHSSSANEWPSVVYNDIVVVPANMLLDSLTDGNVKLTQAQLIVISDAQRVMPMQIPHPIMRIMTDFYAKILDAPRVLATVTSAPDRWASLDLSRLEISFRARSFFLATKAADSWLGPLELVVEHDAYSPTETDLAALAELREAVSRGYLLQKAHVRRIERVFRQLGSHAGFRYAKEVLEGLANSSEQAPEASAQHGLDELQPKLPNSPLIADLGSASCNISPKLGNLRQILSIYDNHSSDFRAIIMVQRRNVGKPLAAILGMPEFGLPFLRPAAIDHTSVRDGTRLVGSNANQQGSMQSLPAVQQDFLGLPSSAAPNVFVITRSTAKLELPPATVVISFDLFDDQLASVYQHARTNGRHSHLIHLVEKGNNEHRRILSRVESVDPELRGWVAKFVQGDYRDAPPKSLYTGVDSWLSDSDEEHNENEEFIVDPTTSARIYKSDAEAAIYRMIAGFEQQVASSEHEPFVSLERHAENGSAERFRCTVSLPHHTGIPSVVGTWCSTQAGAREEAFYRACQESLRLRLLDYRHFPQPDWQVDEWSSPSGENSLPSGVATAAASTAVHGYPRKFPDFWANSRKYPATTLYPTVIIPDNLAGQPHAPVVLLARAPMPHIPDFLLFFSGARATAHFYRGAPFEVSSVQLQALHGYTVRVVRSLTNKAFDCKPEELMCFFAPLASSWHPPASLQASQWSQMPVGAHIPWDAVQLAADYFAVPLYSNLTSLDDNARDAIVQDRNVELTARYFLIQVRHDLTPLSKAEDSAREADYSNFLEYCKARRKDFAGIEDEKQPMVEVAAVPAALNNLHPMSVPPTPPSKAPLKYLIPELTYKFTIPASTFRTLWLLPSIMTRIDGCLLVKELDAKLFHLSISEQLLLVALTTRAAWTEHNYERLEFLGDAFLKVIASNFLYVTMAGAGEGALHYARQGIIRNETLHDCAMRVGVCPYVQHKRFVPKLWLPPRADAQALGGSVDRDEDVQMGDEGASAESGSGKGKTKRSKRQRQMDAQTTLWMGDKTVADVVEAILAAAFLSGGHEVALRAAKRLQLPLPNIAQWTDFARIGARTLQSEGRDVASLLPGTLEAVQALVGTTFSKPALLAQALTHTSAFSGTEGSSYERLEFIGDAILDFLVARHIFERHPHLSPGGLTLLKAAMVSNRALAAFCVHAGLHRYLVIASEQLRDAIARYVDFLEELRKKEYDFATRENRLPGQYWLDMPMDPPKCLSDVVESVIGALYVSDGFFEMGVGRFFDAVFKPFMDAHVRLQTLSTNPKVTLIELLQAEGCQQHAVIKKPQERPNMPVEMEVRLHGQVIASATDFSASTATRTVALAALDALANNPELLAQLCDCLTGDKKQDGKQEKVLHEDEVEAAEVEEAMDAMEGVEDAEQ
ncbi:hypothetical protein BN946_scf185043.g130 [Trametes cinnabarina]|uniref:RNase III domain-containing protein n=1 Tax=Pycnoporus cinnabarinus TaxID=5643 RepID=A0A060SI38_PYCCI|nr:hypothetical protein BN946_scf185043.g130 [Trametes cinnabarina]